jgi:hypothetical protein
MDQNEYRVKLMSLCFFLFRMPVVKGFDFLVNSFWPEVEQRLELHLPLIFAPGNPEMFYQVYEIGWRILICSQNLE